MYVHGKLHLGLHGKGPVFCHFCRANFQKQGQHCNAEPVFSGVVPTALIEVKGNYGSLGVYLAELPTTPTNGGYASALQSIYTLGFPNRGNMSVAGEQND